MNRKDYEDALAGLFVVSLIPLGLGIWRVVEGEWIAGAVLWVCFAIIGCG